MQQTNVTEGDDGNHCAVAIAEQIGTGAIGIIPTETVYGIVCDVGNDAGIGRIYTLKHRDSEKKLQVLIGCIADITACGVVRDPVIDRIAAAFWPGPLTLVTPAESGETIGLRMPKHWFIQRVLRTLGRPVRATSANISGEDPNDCAANNFRSLAPHIDFLVRADGVCGLASTVVKYTAGQITLLREGVISMAKILAVTNV